MGKIAALLIASLSLQGCVGIVARYTATNEMESLQISEKAGIHGVRTFRTTGQGTPRKYDTAWLEDNWGNPDSIEFTRTEEADQIWIYKFDFRWNGIIPIIVIIPIPLVAPVGKERIEFLVKNGDVVGARQICTKNYEAIAGLYLHQCGFSWGFHDRHHPRQP
ncbi:MAG: hypothetical protein LBV12_03655 [Puniceicoccales bacterium]|nr:hypothetical protein [Puniceicoccales bacterium]